MYTLEQPKPPAHTMGRNDTTNRAAILADAGFRSCSARESPHCCLYMRQYLLATASLLVSGGTCRTCRRAVARLRVLGRIDNVRVVQRELLGPKQDVVHGLHPQHQAVVLVGHLVLQTDRWQPDRHTSSRAESGLPMLLVC